MSADEESPVPRPKPADNVQPAGMADRWLGWPGALTGTGIWVILNLVWLQAYRGDRLWDHEEVTYISRASIVGSRSVVFSSWRLLFEGYTPPMQSLLLAPVQLLTGVNEAWVVWLNIVLTAISGLVVYWIGRRLATRAAGMVAATLLLCTSGMQENARGALTMVPASTFTILAVAALVAGRGFQSRIWSLAFGVAVGCMFLSRPMAIAFVPGLIVAGLIWSRATPDRGQVLRHLVLGGVAAIAASAWWWLLTWRDLWAYLTAGLPWAETEDRLHILIDRFRELVLYLNPFSPLVAKSDRFVVMSVGVLALPLVLYVSLRVYRRFAGSPVTTEELDGGASNLATFPLWVVAGTGVVVSLVSNMIGWLILPLVPVIVVAAVVGVRRTLGGTAWNVCATATVLPALIASLYFSTVSTTPGNRYTWCMPRLQVTNACVVETAADAAAWKASLREISDETWAVYKAKGLEDGQPVVAFASRDHLFVPQAFSLQTWVDHNWLINTGSYFSSELTRPEQIDEVRRRAEVVVVVPDPKEVFIYPWMFDPDDVAAELVGRGFVTCSIVPLPDGRLAEVLVREPIPPGACR